MLTIRFQKTFHYNNPRLKPGIYVRFLRQAVNQPEEACFEMLLF